MEEWYLPNLVPVDIVVAFLPHGCDDSLLDILGYPSLALDPTVQGYQEINVGLIVPDRHFGQVRAMGVSDLTR